jgi:membrane protease subunit HflK
MLAPYHIGVEVKDVLIQNIMVPAEVNDAYVDVNNAKAEKTRKLDESEKYKNQVVPNARAQAYKMLQEAEAYKAETVANAQGEVAEFNEVYQKYINNKDITRKRLQIETMELILGSAGKLYIVDDNGSTLKLLNIAGETQPGSPGTTAPVVTATPAPTTATGGN